MMKFVHAQNLIVKLELAREVKISNKTETLRDDKK